MEYLHRAGRPSRLILILLMILTSLSASLGPTRAQEATPPAARTDPAVQISLRPTDGSDGDRFEAEVAPGSRGTLSATMQNFGTEPIELRTFTADVLPVINGGIGIADREREKHEPTTWMDFADETFTLQPGQAVDRPFTISVPAGARPGQYVMAIALETVNPVRSQGAFEQYFRKLVSVYVTVPGPVEPGFSLGQPEMLVEGTTAVLQIPLENTGNVRIDLEGTVTMKDATGVAVLSSPLLLGPIYAWQKTYVQIILPALPPAGTYTVSAEFADDERKITQTVTDQPVDVPAAAADQAPIAFTNVAIVPNASPIQFADISLDIAVKDAPLKSTRLTLSVRRDGELVEDFVLADNLALPQGTTTVTQRYLPAAGWVPGNYTFSLTLESTDPATGATSVVLVQDDVASFQVP